MATMPAAVCLGDPDEDSINVEEEMEDELINTKERPRPQIEAQN
jgi:hypothetical protein